MGEGDKKRRGQCNEKSTSKIYRSVYCPMNYFSNQSIPITDSCGFPL